MMILYTSKSNQMNFYDDHRPAKLLRSAFSSIFYFTWTSGLIIGYSKSISAHAHILYGSTGVYILIFSLLTCKLVHKYEVIGYAVFLAGVALMLTDPFAHKTGGVDEAWIGNSAAFIGAGFGAVLGILSTKNVRVQHPLVMMTHYFIFAVGLQMVVFPYLEDNPLFFSTDSQYGAFGWMTDINLILYLDGFVVPFTGIAANVAFIYCYVYWPIEVICIAALFEPFIAQFAGVMLGQDEIPGTRTLFGLLIISVGMVIASYGAKLKMISKIKSLLDENLN